MRNGLGLALGLGMLALSGAAFAEDVDLNLSSQAALATFSGPLAHVMPVSSGTYDASFLINRSRGNDLFQGTAGALVVGDAGARDANITAGLGGRLIYLHETSQFSGLALQLGGTGEVRIPDFNRLALRAYAYIAPPVLSFGTVEGAYEYAADIDYQVIRQASIYGGWRQLRVDPSNGGTVTADTGLHIGFHLTF